MNAKISEAREAEKMTRISLVVLVLLSSTVTFGQEKPRQATLAQQKMCAEQAKKIFHEDNPTRPEHTVTWTYTSHYEPRTNACYIMTWFYTLQDKSTTTLSHLVYDAFEGREYASFVQVNRDVAKCVV